MIDLDRARALFLGHYDPLLRQSHPFADLVLPGREASHLMHVTDVAWMAHILGGLELSEAERDAWAARIQRDQDPATGLFRYPPGERLIDEHATWQSVGALSILGRSPRHRLVCLEPLLGVDGFRAWCDAYRPGTSHHRFFLAALAAASAPVGDDWKAVFAAWYDARQDPRSGFPCCSNVPGCLSPAFLLTTLRSALCGLPLHADRIVETVLGFQDARGAFTDADLPGYMEMDASFLLHLLGPQAPGASGRIEHALERVGEFLDGVLADPDRRARLLADPHRALAVCGNLSVLWRREGITRPLPWAELEHYAVAL